MNINFNHNIHNINFGEIYLADEPNKKIKNIIPKLDKNFAQKLVELEVKCLRTQYADVFVDKNNKVFVKSKNRRYSKQINSNYLLINNYYNALQYVQVAETQKLEF